MNKKTIETIQRNTTLRVFIAETINNKDNEICQMCYKKFGQRIDWVSAQERSDSAYYKFCNFKKSTFNLT